eukprot:COSAG01_NODE_92_length_27199_cov_100.594649_5_plen_349_part_00
MLQSGIDRVDYEDLHPYLQVLQPLLALTDHLQYYRIERVFGIKQTTLANSSGGLDLGLLALLEKYKLNKSKGPSRFAYVLVKQLLVFSETNPALEQFMSTCRAPQETAPGDPSSFLGWAGKFLAEFQQDMEKSANDRESRERRDSAVATCAKFAELEARCSTLGRGGEAEQRVLWQAESPDMTGTGVMRLAMVETIFEAGEGQPPRETRLSAVVTYESDTQVTLYVDGPRAEDDANFLWNRIKVNLPPTSGSPGTAAADGVCGGRSTLTVHTVFKFDPERDSGWGDCEMVWSWEAGRARHTNLGPHHLGHASQLGLNLTSMNTTHIGSTFPTGCEDCHSDRRLSKRCR